MKIYTLLLLFALGGLQFMQAEVDTIYVKNYEYDDDSLDIDVGDTVIFQWVEGDHPTASDNGDWTTFPMDASNPTKMLVFNTAGNYPYYCTAHGAPGGQGMAGVIIVEDEITGIASAEPEKPAMIYPNPAVGRSTVSFEKGFYSKLEVYNILGRKVWEQTNLQGESKVTIDLSGYNSGNYLVGLFRNGQMAESLRLVKK